MRNISFQDIFIPSLWIPRFAEATGEHILELVGRSIRLTLDQRGTCDGEGVIRMTFSDAFLARRPSNDPIEDMIDLMSRQCAEDICAKFDRGEVEEVGLPRTQFHVDGDKLHGVLFYHFTLRDDD